MSYVAKGALGAVTADQQKGSSADAVRTWAGMKQAMMSQLGVYKYKDGTALTLGEGRVQPMITYEHAVAVKAWWGKFVDRVLARIKADKRDVMPIYEAYQTYQFAYTDWLIKVNEVGRNTFSGRLTLPLTDQFMLATSTLARDLSTAQWKSYNIMTEREMAFWALDNTTGGVLIKPFLYAAYEAPATAAAIASVAKDVAGGAFALAKILPIVLKVSVVAGAAWGGYYVYTKVRAAQSAG